MPSPHGRDKDSSGKCVALFEAHGRYAGPQREWDRKGQMLDSETENFSAHSVPDCRLFEQLQENSKLLAGSFSLQRRRGRPLRSLDSAYLTMPLSPVDARF